MKFVIFPLSITSSWGNGHATNYRALGKALAARGHEVAFLERDVPWYAENRDLERLGFGELHLYGSLDELARRFEPLVRDADVVVVGSYVPQGVDVIRWIDRIALGAKLFYDIDTPVTLAKLETADQEYLSVDVVPLFDLYLSFTGGPVLDRLEQEFGAARARVFYCIVDPDDYSPRNVDLRWDLGYLGTHSVDRERPLETLLVEPARRLTDQDFVVAGPGHPSDVWPANIERIAHLEPRRHADFYNSQRFTLNVTRVQMIAAGYSPSVRLFEAAACGVPIISDRWAGIEEVFTPDKEILVVDTCDEVVDLLLRMDDDARRAVAAAARRRVLAEHTADRRVVQLESYLRDASGVGRAI